MAANSASANYDNSNLLKSFKFGKKLLIFVIVLTILFSSFFIVKPGEKSLVFNKISGLSPNTYGEGMHFKIPLIESAIKMNIRTQKQEEISTAASKDLQDVSATVAVNFMVDQKKLIEIYRNLGQSTSYETDYMQTEIMNPIIHESVKQITAQYTAEELISKRPEVKAKLDQEIKDRMDKYGIKVIDVSITEFKFSDVFTRAIEEKVTAEQNALKEQNNLRVVEFQAQQKIETAKGDAEAIRIINEELSSSPTYVNYLMIQKWDGKMPLALGSGSLLSISNMSN